MLKYNTKKVIELNDWDELVKETYGRPYSFQQQYGCQDRSRFDISFPNTDAEWEEAEMHESIPEKVNGEIMGVKFETWLARDPKQPIVNQEHDYQLELFWERNFYPSVYTIANDLFKRGLVEEGDFEININW